VPILTSLVAMVNNDLFGTKASGAAFFLTAVTGSVALSAPPDMKIIRHADKKGRNKKENKEEKESRL
jgi:hypothetical protein